MSIDWVTVVAQLANFLLLVWLLKRFLYRPILDGIDAREAEIAQRMAAADAARAEAQAAEQRYQQLYERTQSAQQDEVAAALRATEHERQQLLDEARAQREREKGDWQRHLAHERQEFTERLQRAGASTLLELTRKALHDLADERLEAAIARQLAARHVAPRSDELGAAAGPAREAVVRTQHPLDVDARAPLAAALSHAMGGIEPRFVVDDAQSPGVIIEAGGARLEWTIDSYLDELDAALVQTQAPESHLGPAHQPDAGAADAR